MKAWRNEKDLKNAEIDKRILKRELSESENQVKQLKTDITNLKSAMADSQKCHKEAIDELAALNENLADEVSRLKSVILDLENKLKVETEKRNAERQISKQHLNEVKAKEDRICALLKQLGTRKDAESEIQTRFEQVERKNRVLENNLDELGKLKRSIESELEASKQELENAKLVRICCVANVR